MQRAHEIVDRPKSADPHGPRTRGREHEQLEVFVGAWRVSGLSPSAGERVQEGRARLGEPAHPMAGERVQEGRARLGEPAHPMSGEQTYEWLPGRFFLASRWHRRFESGTHVGTGILGFEPETGTFFSHNYDNLGYARQYRVTVRDRVWTFSGRWERAVIIFDPSGDAFSETWEIAKQGAWQPLCELTAKRAQRSREHTIRTYYQAYPSGDRAALESVLAEGFRFTSPYDDALDTAAYFRRCWPNHEHMRSLTIEDLVVLGDEAYVTYRLVTREGGQIRNTERLTFLGDDIASVEVYFGANRDARGAFLPMHGA